MAGGARRPRRSPSPQREGRPPASGPPSPGVRRRDGERRRRSRPSQRAEVMVTTLHSPAATMPGRAARTNGPAPRRWG